MSHDEFRKIGKPCLFPDASWFATGEGKDGARWVRKGTPSSVPHGRHNKQKVDVLFGIVSRHFPYSLIMVLSEDLVV